jgi:pimeloyl-ACP methyl ester carboxylesterase
VPAVETKSGIVLEYETFGSPGDPALLLVMGFSAQMIAWPLGLCERLAAGGRFVIRFDNRDCGLSSKVEGAVAIEQVAAAAGAGDLEGARALAPYTLSEMADDGFGLLDGLGIERAHVFGSSLGGMVAQTMAIEHPERVLSLTSLMSNTGEPEFGQATPEALAALLTPAPNERQAYAEAVGRKSLIWGSRRYADLAAAERLAGESFDRCYCPEGGGRQLAAMLASGSRAEGLRALRVPTLVIHGLDDQLITPSGGERTAELVPDSRLLLLEDMGHDRPEPLWPTLSEAILEHTAGDLPAAAQWA